MEEGRKPVSNAKEPVGEGNGEQDSALQRMTLPVGFSPPEGTPSCPSALRTHSGDTKSPNGVMQVEGGRALTRESGGPIQTLLVTRWMTLGHPPKGSSVGIGPPVRLSVCTDMPVRGWVGRQECGGGLTSALTYWPCYCKQLLCLEPQFTPENKMPPSQGGHETYPG